MGKARTRKRGLRLWIYHLGLAIVAIETGLGGSKKYFYLIGREVGHKRRGGRSCNHIFNSLDFKL
jgi:hypothetical protein